jgi:predicted ATPase/DNA-binding SARP family transcriptional activator
MIEISLLGPWQLRASAGPTKKELRRKEQGLLAYLAVESGQAHSRDTLVGLFWPEMAPADARNNLRVALSRLKRQLGESHAALETTRHSVRFVPTDHIQLDVSQFLAIGKQTETHEHHTLATCQQCQDQLKQSVGLYWGDFLSGFFLEDCLVFEEWLFVWRERLRVQMLNQLDQLVQVLEDDGEYEDAEGYARRRIELNPLHEGGHRQLSRILYAQGNRSAALAQLQLCAQVLRDELGVELEPDTVLLRQEIEAGTLEIKSTTATTSEARPPARRPVAFPENTTPFIGRETELEQLSQRLAQQDYRLISLVGPGGIGKTRLAIQAARAQGDAFEDGVIFVPLEGVRVGSEIPAAIAEAMGTTFTGGAESPQAEILKILRDKQLLLVIDNLEHVLEQGVDLLMTILQTAPHVSLLVTSREQLNAQVEDLFHLRGLPYPETDTEPDTAQYASVRLFADRAHRINKSFTLTDDTLTAVAQICRSVEGLPLALELAATWVRDFSAAQIAESLALDIDLLETDLRDLAPRQRSMDAVFDYSWQLLSPSEQAVLPQLAVFRGSFTLAAAANAAGAMPLVLTRLRYKSLLRGSGDGRYSMHELLRQLSVRKLQEDPAVAEAAQSRHSQYFLDLLQTRAEGLKGGAAAQVGAELRLDLDNIRQAWHWAVKRSTFAAVRQGAAGLAAFFIHMGLGFEAVQLLQTAVDSPDLAQSGQNDILPILLVQQLTLLVSVSTLDEMVPIIERTISLTKGDPALARIEAETYLIWSKVFLDQVSDPKQARVHLDRAITLAATLNDSELEARLHSESGRNYFYDGQFDSAIAMLEKALGIYEALGHVPGQALAYSHLAPAYAEGYRLGPALLCDRRALSLNIQIDNRTTLGHAHNNLAETYVLLGAYEQAKDHALKGLEIYRLQDDKVGEANALSLFAAIMDGLGQTEQTRAQYQAAIHAQKRLKLNFSLSFSLLDWGDFQRRSGRLDEAEIILDEAVLLNSDLAHMLLTSQAKLARVYLAQDNRLEEALALADTVWRAIEPSEAAGLPFPLHTMHEIYSIFFEGADERAEAVLQMASGVLKRTAAEIEDDEMRLSFLNNVSVNRQLGAVLDDKD